ncbi:MAG: FecR family protein [Pseudomonadota bacterium]|nr:FecR family protein [Pseudomonadota bacterium]
MADEQFDKALSDEAIAWFTLLESGEATTADYQRFVRWRALSSTHEQAFDNINALWNDLDGLKDEAFTQALPQQTMAQQAPVAPVPPQSSENKGGLSRWCASLCALLLCIVSGAMWVPDSLTRLASDYQTGSGEQKSITLADGSHVMMDAGSALSVDYSTATRQLTLHQGRAYFTVAADKLRPFVVVSEGGKIQALGTKFDVSQTSQTVAVTVFESAVQVSLAGQLDSLMSGQRLHYSEEMGVSKPQSVDLVQAGAWQRGKLVFNDKPLGEVIDEINRYRQGLVVIVDESLRAFPVSGVFDLNNPDAILQALVEVLPISQRSLTPFLVLLELS